MKDKNYIDRYVREVGRHLPSKMREDVALEIKGALQDVLEERDIDPQDDEKGLKDVLIEYGNPEKVAASYLPERWLVGPSLYPIFMLVLKIVTAVVGGITLLGFLISGVSSGFSATGIWHFLGSLFSNFIGLLGGITFAFALMERFSNFSFDDDEEWDPKSLPEIEDEEQAKRGELIAGIVFSGLALVIFNGFPEWVAIYGSHDSEWGVIARLAPEFMEHIPWLSAIWALEIALKAEVLRSGAWNRTSRIAEFLLGGFTIAVLYRILEGGPILTLSVLSFLVKGALIIALIVTVFEWIAQAYRLIRSMVTVPQAVKIKN